MFFSIFLNIGSFIFKGHSLYVQNKVVIGSIMLLVSIFLVKKYYKPFL